MTQVRISNGVYRNQSVNGVFPLIKDYQVGAKGGFVTVDSCGAFGPEYTVIRVRLNSIDDMVVVNDTDPEFRDSLAPTPKETAPVESEEEAMERIGESFEILDAMSKAAVNGDIRAMIVSGPPGIGKSHGVETIVEKACLFDKLSGKRLRAEVIKGAASAIGLYQVLYKYSDRNSVVVFDDCDSVLQDEECLGLLKGALDSGKKRRINWLRESRVLKEAGVPNSFDFNGSIIFITNLKFDQNRGNKMDTHLSAVASRCHYLDLKIDSVRDMMLRVRQVARDSDLFYNMDLSKEAETEVIEFMDLNKNRLRELSLRMAIKIAQLRKSFPDNWTKMARSTCMK